MSASSSRRSLVRSTYSSTGPIPSKCGYCKSENSFLVEAVWGFRLTCQDYQDLVDRGFQRSGNFVYRPVMKETCCPQYVLRTDAVKFKPTKSQRYAIRKFNRFLVEGRPIEAGSSDSNAGPASNTDPASKPVQFTTSSSNPTALASNQTALASDPTALTSDPTALTSDQTALAGNTVHTKKEIKPGKGADPNKPRARKAKELRKERRQLKALNRSATPSSMTMSSSSLTPSLVDHPLEKLLSLPDPASCKHKFECRLVSIQPLSQEYLDTLTESYELFVKFQITIHKEKKEDCTIRNFRDFIEQTPLLSTEGPSGMSCGYGTYHQQYFIDGKLFAVGVLDILPRGILCEYFYYDPSYRFLNPGVYGAMNEIAFTQRFYKINPSVCNYYMGFYVQSCPKMSYKSQYSPSSLLCPETHTYVPLQLCIPKLIASGYSRLADDSVANVRETFTQDEVDSLLVFSLSHASEQPVHQDMSYAEFKAYYGSVRQSLMEEYVRIVGIEVASRTTIFLPF